MTLSTLQVLTWGTVTGAVVSALLLAAGGAGLPDHRRGVASRDGAIGLSLPSEPTAAGAAEAQPVSLTKAGEPVKRAETVVH